MKAYYEGKMKTVNNFPHRSVRNLQANSCRLMGSLLGKRNMLNMWLLFQKSTKLIPVKQFSSQVGMNYNDRNLLKLAASSFSSQVLKEFLLTATSHSKKMRNRQWTHPECVETFGADSQRHETVTDKTELTPECNREAECTDIMGSIEKCVCVCVWPVLG